jgi:hypothetical protein
VFPAEHCFAIGVHAPAHTPALQTLGHAVPLCHVPVLSHVCGVFPVVHCFVCGVHIPVHAPLEHTYAHGAPVCH